VLPYNVACSPIGLLSLTDAATAFVDDQPLSDLSDRVAPTVVPRHAFVLATT
jgi:hypothetical protein